MKCTSFCLALFLSLTSAFAAVKPNYSNDDKTMTVTVETGEEDTLDIAIPSTITNLIKLGEGKLTLTTAAAWDDNTGYLEVREGTFVVGSSYANLGTPKVVTVSDGATLDLSGFNDRYTRESPQSYLHTQFYVSGNGYNGAGAIRRARADSTGGNRYNQSIIKFLTLLGDTKLVGGTYTNSSGNVTDISADHGWGVGQYGSNAAGTPVFNMNSHDLTVEGSMSIGNSGASGDTTLKNPGNITILDNGRLIMPSMQYLTIEGTGAKTFPQTMDKSITLGNSAYMMVYMLRNAPTFTYKLVVPKGNTTRYYQVANNDATRGYIRLPLCVDGVLYIQPSNSSVFPLNFLAPVTGSGTIYTYSSVARDYANKVENRFSAVNNFSIGSLRVMRAPTVFENVGIVSVTNFYKHSGTLYGKAETIIGGSTDSDNYIARLNLRGNTHLSGKNGACSDHAIMVGQDKFGILDISDGATVSNMIYMARQNGDYGALYLSGDNSEIYWPSTANNRSLVGDVGYGAVMMYGGKATLDGNTVLFGRNGGSGYWFQTAGSTLVKGSYLWLARPLNGSGSSADLHVEGGTFEARNKIYIMNPDSGYAWHGPRAVITVGGGTSAALLKTTEIASYATTNKNGCTSIINLNTNGTLVADKIYRTAATVSSMEGHDWSKSRIYINFNGGTLKFNSNQTEFFHAANVHRLPTRICVYEGGATFDTDGHDVGFSGALVKPQGKGVASVTMPDDYTDTINGSNKFIGVSRVISSNTPFSGITDFDKTDRSAKRIIITCPGYDASESNNVRFMNLMRNATDCINITFADLATTGGITKKGSGTLTLKSANTYGGTTRVLEGTLAFTNASGYPGGDLEIPASALASGSDPFISAASFSLASDKKIRITGLDPNNLNFQSLGHRLLIQTTAAMDASIINKLELKSASGETIPSEVLSLTLSPDGKRLFFRERIGLTIFIN